MGKPIIAALLLDRDRFDMPTLQQKLVAARPGGIVPTDIEVTSGILTFYLNDDLVAVAPMPAPYPWSDLKGPCETSWMWPRQTPASTLQRHSTHVLITATGGQAGPIHRRLAFTQVVAISAAMPGVIGVYWPEGTLVHYPPVFMEMAQEISNPKSPPLNLWVDFRVFRNADGSAGLFTTGLSPLGRREIEVPRVTMKPSELYEWAMNIAGYVLENGDRIKDGHTIGTSAHQKIRVRFGPSQFGGKGEVMRLEA